VREKESEIEKKEADDDDVEDENGIIILKALSSII